MLPNPVDYTIYRGGELTLAPGKAYAYLMAGGGLFKYARNRHIEALVPVAPAQVAGLPPLTPFARLLAGRIPERLLATVLADARRVARERPREAMYHFYCREGAIQIARPVQRPDGDQVTYVGGSDPDIVLDLHSHHQMRAFFSNTDDRDELGFRAYAVIGCIFTKPEIRVRVGVYGDHWEMPLTMFFTGPGPFVDASKEAIRRGDPHD